MNKYIGLLTCFMLLGCQEYSWQEKQELIKLKNENKRLKEEVKRIHFLYQIDSIESKDFNCWLPVPIVKILKKANVGDTLLAEVYLSDPRPNWSLRIMLDSQLYFSDYKSSLLEYRQESYLIKIPCSQRGIKRFGGSLILPNEGRTYDFPFEFEYEIE